MIHIPNSNRRILDETVASYKLSTDKAINELNRTKANKDEVKMIKRTTSYQISLSH